MDSRQSHLTDFGFKIRGSSDRADKGDERMTIEGLLEKLLKETNARVSLDDRRMYWDEDTQQWVVLKRGAYSHTTLYRGTNFDGALNRIKEG